MVLERQSIEFAYIFQEKVSLKVSQNSQENNCTGVYF